MSSANCAEEIRRLQPLAEDGLVHLEKSQFVVTPLGRFFLRNVGMVFDAYLKPGNSSHGQFSKTV